MPGEVDPKAAQVGSTEQFFFSFFASLFSFTRSQALVSGSGTLLSGLHGNELDDALLLRQLVFANVNSKQRVRRKKKEKKRKNASHCSWQAYLVDAMKQRGDSVGVVLESSKDVAAAQRSDISFAFQCSPDACKEVRFVSLFSCSLSFNTKKKGGEYGISQRLSFVPRLCYE